MPKYVVELWFEKQSTVMRHDRGRIDHHESPCLLECILMRWKLVEATKIGLYVVNFLCPGKQWLFMEKIFVSIINFRIEMLRFFFTWRDYKCFVNNVRKKMASISIIVKNPVIIIGMTNKVKSNSCFYHHLTQLQRTNFLYGKTRTLITNLCY